MPQSPITQPLGGATISGTLVTVDTYVNPPTKIPSRIAALAANNFGYFMENVLATPGMRVEGGAVLYEIVKPYRPLPPRRSGSRATSAGR